MANTERNTMNTELRINDKGHFALNIDKIMVGVENPSRQEIAKDTYTGLNYARNAVEPKEIYNKTKQRFTNWFILDLETGSRGWFPGAIIYGNIIESTNIMSKPSHDSEILETIDHAIVKILDLDAIDDEPYYEGWYKIKYDIEGFVPVSSVTDIRYEGPDLTLTY